MGATNNIKETNISLQLQGKKCSQCDQPFTAKDIEERNWEVWFDTSNDVKLVEMEEIASKFDRSRLEQFNDQYFNMLYYPFGRSGYQFSIWIRSIDHEVGGCPDIRELREKYGKKQQELKANESRN